MQKHEENFAPNGMSIHKEEIDGKCAFINTAAVYGKADRVKEVIDIKVDRCVFDNKRNATIFDRKLEIVRNVRRYKQELEPNSKGLYSIYFDTKRNKVSRIHSKEKIYNFLLPTFASMNIVDSVIERMSIDLEFLFTDHIGWKKH